MVYDFAKLVCICVVYWAKETREQEWLEWKYKNLIAMKVHKNIIF